MMLATLLLPRLALFGAVGLALGGAYFAALHVNARLYLTGGPRRARAVALHVLRMALLCAALVGVARFGGGGALVSAFVGLLVARQMVTARVARAQ